MSALLVFLSTIKNPDKFRRYAESVGPTLNAYKGEVILKGKTLEVVKGSAPHNTIGVLKFPTQEQASGWYSSPEYQSLVTERDEAADILVIRADQV